MRAAVGLLLAPWVVALPAQAHSFLVSAETGQGARLPGPPREIAFQFTEPVVMETMVVTLARATADPARLEHPTSESGGRVVRFPLLDLGEGVYVVGWEVTSAVDLHTSSGEFAFAVGEAGAVPELGEADVGGDGNRLVRTLVIPRLSLARSGIALPLRPARPPESPVGVRGIEPLTSSL